jgi:hypothetical protein
VLGSNAGRDAGCPCSLLAVTPSEQDHFRFRFTAFKRRSGSAVEQLYSAKWGYGYGAWQAEGNVKKQNKEAAVTLAFRNVCNNFFLHFHMSGGKLASVVL